MIREDLSLDTDVQDTPLLAHLLTLKCSYQAQDSILDTENTGQ